MPGLDLERATQLCEAATRLHQDLQEAVDNCQAVDLNRWIEQVEDLFGADYGIHDEGMPESHRVVFGTAIPLD